MSERDAAILSYDLFQGDETDVRELSNRMVVTQKPHSCCVCWGDISIGSRVRALVEANNETKKVMTFYSCPLCCEAMAMAITAEDNGKAIEARTAIGIKRAREKYAERSGRPA